MNINGELLSETAQRILPIEMAWFWCMKILLHIKQTELWVSKLKSCFDYSRKMESHKDKSQYKTGEIKTLCFSKEVRPRVPKSCVFS